MGHGPFIYFDSIPNANLANNPNIGIPGYFFIEDTKVKIDMFQNLNGGQLGKKFGRIQENGDIIFYDQRPETYFSSFRWLEKAEGKERFSIWKKVQIEGLKNYAPDW